MFFGNETSWDKKLRFLCKSIKMSGQLKPYSPKLRQVNGKRQIWDNIRQKYVSATPEEMVRQQVIHYLINERLFPVTSIAIEKGLELNGLQKRFDVLIYSEKFEPLILVECKAASVKLSEAAVQQAANYNMVLRVPYLLITNGTQWILVKIDHTKKSFDRLLEIPKYQNL